MKKVPSQKYYIGIASGFHDAAIALVNENGEVIFAEATERFLQSKRALTSVADNYFLSEKIIKHFPFSEYEIAINWKLFEKPIKNLIAAFAIHTVRRYKKFNYFVAKYLYKLDVDLFSSITDFQASSQFAMLSAVGASFKNALYINSNLPYKTNSYFDHHTCHAFYAYYTSPVTSAVILVIDGNGDQNIACSLFTAETNNVKKVHKNKYKGSLGDFYGEITKWCGFSEIGGEQWKVMGMAPSGKLNELLLADLKNWFSIEHINIKKNNCEQVIKQKIVSGVFSRIPKADIAFTCQFFYETLVIELINNIYTIYPHSNLILSGGCALNSVANGKIHKHTPYKNVFVSSAPADDGCAVGAALLNFKKHNPLKTIPQLQVNPYLGFAIADEEIEHFLSYSGYTCKKLSYEEIYKKTAQYLYNGFIVAWAQGNAEFGPRALGNRSIIANPCLPGMKDKINSTVKFREEFRPFAPSILEEQGEEYFEDYIATPYMERVLQIKEDKRHLIPAVTHINGSGRLQTVTKEGNFHFYNLITEFYKLSNIPMVLNTSLNTMGKPIVSSVSDIASVFATSGIDVMVINNYLILKKE